MSGGFNRPGTLGSNAPDPNPVVETCGYHFVGYRERTVSRLNLGPEDGSATPLSPYQNDNRANLTMTNTNVVALDLDYADTLWKAADALRGQVDAAEYKHVVLVSCLR